MNFKKTALSALIGTTMVMGSMNAFAASVKLTLGGTIGSAAETFGSTLINSAFYTPCHAPSNALAVAQAAEATALTTLTNDTAAVTSGQKIVTDLTTLQTTVQPLALANPGNGITPADIDAINTAIGNAAGTPVASINGGNLTADTTPNTPPNSGTVTGESMLQDYAATIAGLIQNYQLALDQAGTGLLAKQTASQAAYNAKVAATTAAAAGPVINGTNVNNYKDQLQIGLDVLGNVADANGNYMYDVYFMMVNLSAPGKDSAFSNAGVGVPAATTPDYTVIPPVVGFPSYTIGAADVPEAKIFMFTRETPGANSLTLNNPLTIKTYFTPEDANAALRTENHESFNVTFNAAATANKTFIFDGVTYTSAGGLTTVTAEATAYVAAYNANPLTTWIASNTAGVVKFTKKTPDNVTPNIVIGDFTGTGPSAVFAPGITNYTEGAATTYPTTGIAYARKELFTGTDYITASIEGGLDLETSLLPRGTWLALAILGDTATLDFRDPKTWVAWDAAAVILGSPFGSGDTGLAGQMGGWYPSAGNGNLLDKRYQVCQ